MNKESPISQPSSMEITTVEKFEHDRYSKNLSAGLGVGIVLTSSTLALIVLLGTSDFQKSNSARYVASFLAGLFGFAAVETFRRTLQESKDL